MPVLHKRYLLSETCVANGRKKKQQRYVYRIAADNIIDIIENTI